MKKRMKKIMSLLLCIAVSFGTIGCGNAGSANSSNETAKEESGQDESAASSNASQEGTEESIGENAGTESGGKKVAYISAANQFDFFVYIGAEIKRIGEENGIQVDMFDAALDVSKESDLMSQAILQGYDAIIVGPVDTEALVPSIKEANEAGIPVINYDSFIEGADVYARVGSSNAEMGKMAGEYAAKLLEEKNGEAKGTIIVLSYPALETMNQRIAGFKEVLEQYPDVTVKEETVEECTAEGGQKLTDNLLIANPEGSIDIIYGSNAGVVLGALASVSSADRDDVALIGIDNEEGQLNALKDGRYYKATIAQDSYAIGEAAMNAAIEAINGEKTGDIVVQGVLVTPENVEEYLVNDQAKKAELEAYK